MPGMRLEDPPVQGALGRSAVYEMLALAFSYPEPEAADRLERAVAAVIAEGKYVTYDLKPRRDDPTAVGTQECADAIIEKIRAGV